MVPKDPIETSVQFFVRTPAYKRVGAIMAEMLVPYVPITVRMIWVTPPFDEGTRGNKIANRIATAISTRV
jgi:hypothetical protein